MPKAIVQSAPKNALPDDTGFVEVEPFILHSRADAAPSTTDAEGNEVYIMPQVHDEFMDDFGNIVYVATGCGRVVDNSDYGKRYALITISEKLKLGWVPLGACPSVANGPYSGYLNTGAPIDRFAKPVEDCTGGTASKPCMHFVVLKEKRHARALELHNSKQKEASTMSTSDIERMAGAFGSVIAAANADRLPAPPRRDK